MSVSEHFPNTTLRRGGLITHPKPGLYCLLDRWNGLPRCHNWISNPIPASYLYVCVYMWRECRIYIYRYSTIFLQEKRNRACLIEGHANYSMFLLWALLFLSWGTTFLWMSDHFLVGVDDFVLLIMARIRPLANRFDTPGWRLAAKYWQIEARHCVAAFQYQVKFVANILGLHVILRFGYLFCEKKLGGNLPVLAND